MFIAEVNVPMVVEGIQVCQITERFCLWIAEARGKATGIDSVESSEIDTEDELAAVRKVWLL